MGCLTTTAGARRSALPANRLLLPCSAGVRFLPGLKAGASPEESGETLAPPGILGSEVLGIVPPFEALEVQADPPRV
jgi:hypothetical protein